jgi:2-succinyl-5-enolpyruvyl-6-hydroxy-3-cyclohexene-1-carboxylate synthase
MTADPAETALRWCLALVDGLMAGGMRHLVLSPGSRSTPMVLAAQARPGLALTPILDERSAAFYALGLARSSGRPVGLLATSGSAPAHWYPAVIESETAGVPLVLISADRPPELCGWGANQTIDQTRLFGTLVRAFHDPGAPVGLAAARRAVHRLGLRAAAQAQGRDPGPVHINLPLREPLVPERLLRGDALKVEDPLAPEAISAVRPEVSAVSLPQALLRRLVGRGLIYCGPGEAGDDLAGALWSCAAALGVPVLTDPLSGLRFAPAGDPAASPRVGRYKLIVRNPAAARALRPDWVLHLGRPAISKTVGEWLAGIPRVLVDPAGRWGDPGHDLALHLDADPVALCRGLAAEPPRPADPGWLAGWRGAEARAESLTLDYLETAPWCEAQLIRDLVARLPKGEGLLCGNSLPIRQLETWAGARQSALRLFGNRGASGIDGQTSTLAGLNRGGVPTSGLLGDLSFLHDLSGLLLLAPLDRPLVVLNNGGGRIFDYLPQAGLPGLERLWRTPRPVPLGDLVRPFGLGHLEIGDQTGWDQAWAETRSAVATGAPCPVIEARIDAATSQAMHLDFRRLVSESRLLD